MVVSPEHWTQFCATFSYQHRGWLVSLGRADTESLRHNANAPWKPLMTEEEPLFGLECCDTGCVLTVGEGTAQSLIQVTNPIQITAEETERGSHTGLRIDKADGESILLRFRASALPEELDGLAPNEL